MKKILIFLLAIFLVGCSSSSDKKKKVDSKTSNDGLYLPIINTKDNKLGYINAKDGKIVIEPQFTTGENTISFDAYNNQYALIIENSNWKIIDTNGKISFDSSKQDKNYTLVSNFIDNKGNIYAISENNEYVKINGDGTVKSTEYYPYTSHYTNSIQNPDLICYCKENDNYYYALDDKQNVIFKSEHPFIFRANEDIYDENIGICYIDTGNDGPIFDKYDFYFIDNNGNKLFDGKVFNSVEPFNKKGYTVVSNSANANDVNNQYYLIDKDGKEIYQLQDNEFAYFTDNEYYIVYYEGDNCGMKDSQNNIVIEAKYNDILLYGDCLVCYQYENNSFDLYNIDKTLIKHFEAVGDLQVVNKFIIVDNQYIYDLNGQEIVNLKDLDSNLKICENNKHYLKLN